ncbi:hypothetical protein V5T82_00875 [Magnetovibrio sp. PR-2]|uniref:hypothetical protein n=1 Tax=Magnetovibrio sp. PR-2 TaxID=3120356 RepID=UPI002FCDFC3F
MLNFRSSVLIAVTAILLSACQSNYGQGELRLAGSTVRGLEKYMAESHPTVFAVSMDGTRYRYYFCSIVTCGDNGAAYHKAIQECENELHECKLLASRKRIVWQKDNGEFFTLKEILSLSQTVQHSAHMSKSDKDICTQALNDTKDRWTDDGSRRAFIKAALIRKLSPADCALVLHES